jgi:hypothetical protein
VTLNRRFRRRQALQVSFDADATSGVAVVAIRHALIESSAINQDGMNRRRRVCGKRRSQNRGAAQWPADRFSRYIRLTKDACAKCCYQRKDRTSACPRLSMAHQTIS